MLEHGGRLRKAAIQYGIAEADWLDLSSGLAPWPWPIPEIPLRAWARLPESDDGLEQAASEYYGAAHLLPVPGSQAAIQLLPRLRRAGKVGVLSPCYAEHAEAWRRAGYVVREVQEQEVDFFLDGLDVLVHPNTLAPRDDHLHHALWLGHVLALVALGAALGEAEFDLRSATLRVLLTASLLCAAAHAFADGALPRGRAGTGRAFPAVFGAGEVPGAIEVARAAAAVDAAPAAR